MLLGSGDIPIHELHGTSRRCSRIACRVATSLNRAARMSSNTLREAPIPAPLSALRSIVWLSLLFAAIKVTLHIVTNILAQRAGYGIFRDEMYYLICGRYL